ncbi:MAG: mycofactocin radical SAM maturase [Firmicutes bacterium]|nr:mycofactocin radical SAM maturase [Bacillota bacterium]
MKEEYLYNNRKLSAPVNVTWEVTYRCNLSCRHCLSAGTTANCRNDMALEQCKRFIDDLKRIKVFQVNIGGGEPFLRADILEILNYAHEKGIVTCVSTNGTLVDDSLAKRLSQMDLIYIQVSLDGAKPETNDQIRGKGTFQRIIAGIELFNKYNFPNLSINTVVTRINFKEIIEIYKLGKYFKAKTRLSRFRPSGGAKKIWKDYHLTREQTVELASFLSEYRDVLTGDSFFSITAEDRKDLGLNMCGAAKMTCSVSPDGSVYPCAFLQEEYFYAGNILKESLGNIWHNSNVFNMLRGLNIEACKNCSRFNICHGGCPAVAFFLKNELNCPDPECIYQIGLNEQKLLS